MGSGRRIGVPLAVAGVAAGAAIGLRARRGAEGGPGADRSPDGWKAVTVLVDEQGMRPGGAYPQPLRDLEDRLEIRLKPASRDRGTELHARFRPGAEPDPQALRAALRDAKSLIETGIVQHADPVPHGNRKHTPFGAAQDAVESKAKGSGLL